MEAILATKPYVDAQSQNKFSVYGFNSDEDSAPTQVSNDDGIPAAAFPHGTDRYLVLETDWAKRADIPVSLEYFMDTEEAAKALCLQLGYSFDGASFAWLDAETVTAPSDKLSHQISLTSAIPSSAIPVGDAHTLRIKIRRLGSNDADTHDGNFCLTSVKYYRV